MLVFISLQTTHPYAEKINQEVGWITSCWSWKWAHTPHSFSLVVHHHSSGRKLTQQNLFQLCFTNRMHSLLGAICSTYHVYHKSCSWHFCLFWTELRAFKSQPICCRLNIMSKPAPNDTTYRKSQISPKLLVKLLYQTACYKLFVLVVVV